MTEDRVRRRLEDLARFGEEAQFIAGRGREAYLADTMGGALLGSAAERILINVATVTEKLPAEFKARHSEVEWVGTNRMRNLAHHYDKVSDDLMWQSLTVRTPQLVHDLRL